MRDTFALFDRISEYQIPETEQLLWYLLILLRVNIRKPHTHTSLYMFPCVVSPPTCTNEG